MGCGVSSVESVQYKQVSEIFVKDGEWIDSFETLAQINNLESFNKQLEHLCSTNVLFEMQETILTKIMKSGNIEGLRIVTKYYPNISNVTASSFLPMFVKNVDFVMVSKEQLRALVIFMKNCSPLKIEGIDVKIPYTDIGILELVVEHTRCCYASFAVKLKQLADEKLLTFNFVNFLLYSIEQNVPVGIDNLLEEFKEYNEEVYSKIWNIFKMHDIVSNKNICNYIKTHRNKHSKNLVYRSHSLGSQEEVDFVVEIRAKMGAY